MPWVADRVDLQDATVIEVGCGTGAKTAAFAQHVGRVLGCDVSAEHLAAAGDRLAAMGIENAELHAEDAATFLDRVEANGERPDVFLLFAVIEHMTVEERLEALERGWRLLRPGGVLVVVETPNRLLPWDWHSSRLPFFDQLPDALALRYFERSPRADFVASVRAGLKRGPEEGALALTRQGRGASYHEFEVAIPEPLASVVAGDGYDPEMIALNPIGRDEVALLDFFMRAGLARPVGFSRSWLDLILRKPGR